MNILNHIKNFIIRNYKKSEKEIEASLYDFLKRRLKEGIYTEDFEMEFMPVEV